MNNTDTFAALEAEFQATVGAYEAAKTAYDKAKTIFDLANFAANECVVKHSQSWIDAHAKAGQALPGEESPFDGFALNTLVEAAKNGMAGEVFAKYVKKARLMAETDAKPTWATKGLKMARIIDGAKEEPVVGVVEPVAMEAEPVELLPWENPVVVDGEEIVSQFPNTKKSKATA